MCDQVPACPMESDAIIGCEYGWCSVEGIMVCVCVGGKM